MRLYGFGAAMKIHVERRAHFHWQWFRFDAPRIDATRFKQSIAIPCKSVNASRIAVLLGASIQSLGMIGACAESHPIEPLG
jgi:hypothetical protein